MATPACGSPDDKRHLLKKSPPDTISNVTYSGQPTQEAHMAPPADVLQLCRETFLKTSEYLKGELEGTIEDYKLLENMNRLALTKYSEMKQLTDNIGTAMQDLNDKYKGLQPYLDQIDQIEESVSSLEQTAYRLDAYSKRLESKFKMLEKR